MYPSAIGLDLSLTGAGWATSQNNEIRVGRVESTGKATFSLHERYLRLRNHADDMINLIPADALVVIEQPSYGSTAGSQHDRSGFWWMVVSGAYARGHRIVEIPPTSLKLYATGAGGANKEAMLLAADRLHPSVGITNNDEADALMLLSMGMRFLESPLEKLPAKHLSGLKKIRWP